MATLGVNKAFNGERIQFKSKLEVNRITSGNYQSLKPPQVREMFSGLDWLKARVQLQAQIRVVAHFEACEA